MIIGTNSKFFVNQNNSFVKVNDILGQINKKTNNKVLDLPNFTFDEYSFNLKFESNSEYDFIKKICDNFNSIQNTLNIVNANLSFSKFIEIPDSNFVIEYKENLKNFLKVKNVYDMNSKNSMDYYTNILPALNGITIADNLFLDNRLVKVFVKLVDLFLTVPLTFFEDDMNEFVRKKFFYAGDYSKYSNEITYYFTSNFWLAPEYINIAKFVHGILSFCYEFVLNEDYLKFYNINGDNVDVFGYDYFDLVNCLNNNNKSSLKKYLYFTYNFLPESLVNDIETYIKH